MPKRSGFTLIELLVVIAIIAILAAIGFVTYSTVQKNARDTRRRVEVDTIAKALEIRYQITSGANCPPGGGASNGGAYCPLDNSWFANNPSVVPADTGVTKYCITSSTNSPPPSLPAAIPTAAQWSNGTVACPTGAGLSGAGNTDFTTIAAGSPVINTTVWRLCAYLEKDNSVYCVSNKQ